MRKVILYIAASLDGYIARPDDRIDWLVDERYTIKNEDYGYSRFMESVDTTLMGNSTYKAILGMDMPFPYTDKTNFVFSRSQHPDTRFVKFVQNDPVTFTRELKQQPGKNIWLIGGGELNMQLLNAGLIDEMILTIIPVILGSGIPLFAAGTQEKLLQLQHTQSYSNGFVQVTYTFTSGESA